VVTYADTSFLVCLYVGEEQTPIAAKYAETLSGGMTFTPFHRLELRTALRHRMFREELTHAQLQLALRRNEADVRDGLLRHTPLPWADALREAERLGAAYLSQTGGRTGDLLHVASAVVLEAREFLTFDQRQMVLARRAGLKVKTWKSRQQRSP
jgi:predicted nucleic acid-binding protein